VLERPEYEHDVEAAMSQLAGLLGSVDLSAPSSTKFTDVRTWLGERALLEPRRVAVYWVSKPGNLDVRFQQPGVFRDEPFLGIALIPGGDSPEAYHRPARRLVENGLFQAMVLCSRSPSGWTFEGGYIREGSPIDATIGGLVDQDAILAVGDPSEYDVASDDQKRTHDPLPSVGWGEYPLDAVFVRTETRTVAEVVKRIRAGRYQLDPDFQRDFVWPVLKQSRLIESCTMRIPLPVFYVAEAKDGRIVVVDGLQRLTTFHRYLSDEFALAGLDDAERNVRHPLTGKKFSQLPLSLMERIEDTQLTLYVLDAKAPERAKLDIFERVNSGISLSRQQMRNCLFNGSATTWLKLASQNSAFLDATGRSLDTKSMRDREAINRFCAFRLNGWRDYQSGDMDGFLAQALERMNEYEASELDGLMTDFVASMEMNLELFGRHAFRKSLASEDSESYRTVINIALFDVCSVLLANGNPARIAANADSIRRGFRDLISNDAFSHAITYSTNSTRQVQSRFQMAADAVGSYLE